MIPDHLRLHPGQQALTPEQEAEAQRFAQERIAAQLSTEPVDEAETEALMRQAYKAASLPAPRHIHWLDGPLPLVAALAPRHKAGVYARVVDSAWKSLRASVWDSLDDDVATHLREPVRQRVWASVGISVRECVWPNVHGGEEVSQYERVDASVEAYFSAPGLSFYRFFDEYLEPNTTHALARFNEQVSGYWLGNKEALLVRRPRLLSRDQEGRLHSNTSKCIEYHDGWGFYAWHGVRVPEQVILRPQTLTREDFLNAPDVEVRRIIQERMGSRFVAELGGVVLDAGPRGTLYEVQLPNDPERVARYVQVQDASTGRQYFLRVPPTIQTAAEAVAWSFQMAVEAFAPSHET